MQENSPNLDLLRSVAVSTVMIDHLVPTLVYKGFLVPSWLSAMTAHVGQAGVLAFFVHTSLVLMYSLRRMERGSTTRTDLAARFYVRRAFRIYPLAIAVIVLVLATSMPAMTWRETPPITSKIILANVLLIQNLWTGQSVLGPLWSLPYEVEMYALLPLGYFVAVRKDGPPLLTAALATACLLGFAVAFAFGGRTNLAGYMPCFICGVLCFSLRTRQKPQWSASSWPIFIAGLFFIYCVVHLWFANPVFWIGWIFCLVLAIAINQFRQSEHAATNWWFEQIAKYSYGLYLFHVPALYLVFDVLHVGSASLGVLAYVTASIAASVVAYHLLEHPFIAFGQRLTARKIAAVPESTPTATRGSPLARR